MSDDFKTPAWPTIDAANTFRDLLLAARDAKTSFHVIMRGDLSSEEPFLIRKVGTDFVVLAASESGAEVVYARIDEIVALEEHSEGDGEGEGKGEGEPGDVLPPGPLESS